jgi:hypothetical protein
VGDGFLGADHHDLSALLEEIVGDGCSFTVGAEDGDSGRSWIAGDEEFANVTDGSRLRAWQLRCGAVPTGRKNDCVDVAA